MDRFYRINFKRLALLLLPTFYRRPLLAAVAYAAVMPLQQLHTRFMRWKADTDSRLACNGQVCRLEALLNDRFDPGARRITLTDEQTEGPRIVFRRRDAAQSLRLPLRGGGRGQILNRRGYGGVNGFDFWVNLPLALYERIDPAQVRAVAARYKLACKRFSINFI